MPELIDLRSDTVTQPTPAMRQAMADAPVGDDIFSEDPTVNRLQEKVAELLGKEDALFMPTGTMSNQCAIKTHCQPADELLCEANNHILHYETGGPAVLSGVMCRTVEGQHGIPDLAQLEGLPRGFSDHTPLTRLLCLENTHNRGGGSIHPFDKLRAICDWAKKEGLARHLDGARLMNAVVATGVPAQKWASQFDTVSICFSKGLGAPVGSALVGPKEFIVRARRFRKLLGGGMRQSGHLAAAAIHALDHHVERLAEDHKHAKELAAALADLPGLVPPAEVHTNILYLKLATRLGPAARFCDRLREKGVLALPMASDAIRLVTHLNVSGGQIEKAAFLIKKLVRELGPHAA